MMTERPLATPWPHEFAWIIPLLRREAKLDCSENLLDEDPHALADAPSMHGVLVGTVALDQESWQALDDLVHRSLNFYRVPDPFTSEHMLVRFNAAPRRIAKSDRGGAITHETHIELRILPSHNDA